MHTVTIQAERKWIKAQRHHEEVLAVLKEWQERAAQSEAELQKAKKDYKDYLELDGIDFEERQAQRAARGAILSSLAD